MSDLLPVEALAVEMRIALSSMRPTERSQALYAIKAFI
jgi:hypothetical protein